MPKRYVGHLPSCDPLHHYLQYDILPRMGQSNCPARFRVFQYHGSNEVYLYEEQHTGLRVIGKFFAGHGCSFDDEPGRRMEQEHYNLDLLRSYGLCGHPHHVVRPLGHNRWLSSLLVEEYSEGRPLSVIMTNAVAHGPGEELFAKLTALAYFLATLHNRTANGYAVDFGEDCSYLHHLVHQLVRKQLISLDEASELYWLGERWYEQPRMWEDQQVWVHGDATPANFLFGQGLHVTAIDLERMKRADRVFDVGRIAGELQHFFLQATGNKYAAEPFIGHFLWEYACHFPDRQAAFRSISGRVAFQMGLTLLRIARNSWVDPDHHRRLIEEAKITLRTF
jgi:hypothetical protein